VYIFLAIVTYLAAVSINAKTNTVEKAVVFAIDFHAGEIIV
jgi:hypothetical protein